MTLEKNKLSSNNLILRIFSAIVALLVLFFTLHYFKINGAFVLVLIISCLIGLEISSMFFKNDLFFKYAVPAVTTTSLWMNFEGIYYDFEVLPIFIGLTLIPWIYRTSEVQISFDKFIVYLLVILYGYFLPTQILKIFFLDSNFIYFYFFGALVFGTDTLAYFFGKVLGHKLFNSTFQPKISTSKTVEGFLGSLIWPALAIFVTQEFKIFEFSILSVFLLYLTAFSSISGDLIASLIKRKSQNKDSGRIFPGHGGFLDRLDSLLLSAPIFILSSYYFALI